MLCENKRKKFITLNIASFITIIILLQFLFTMTAFAEQDNDENRIIDEQSQSDEVKKIEAQLKENGSEEAKEILPNYNPENFINDTAKGKFEFSLTGILRNAAVYLFKEIYQNINILIKLIVLTILCSVLKTLQNTFLSENIGELAFYVCYIIIVSILTVSINTVLTLGNQVVDNMVAFMQATVPVLITLLVSGGNLTSGGIFQPVLISVVEITATIIRNVFIPLIFLSAILSIVNNISDKVQISKLAGFLKQITGWGLGLILTVFIGVITIQGSLGAVVDGVTSKTAKFAIGAFIPVAGKYLSDAADTVVACTLLIKNAAGLAVMIGIITLCIVPLLKILALTILYRITCVLIEPISEKRIVNCVNDIAGSLTFFLGIVASVAFMFLIAVTAIISAGNVSAMVR